MSVTVDVNVLLYASNVDAAEHGRAVALMNHLATGPSLVVLLWPTLMGYLRVATHPAIFSKPLSPDVAADNVASLINRPHVRTAGETDGFWDAYRGVAANVLPRGNLVSDAHLVVLMQQHGVSMIWSRDRDLRKFDGITVKDPFSDRFVDGFT